MAENDFARVPEEVVESSDSGQELNQEPLTEKRCRSAKLGFFKQRRARADEIKIRQLQEHVAQAKDEYDKAGEALRKTPGTGGYSGEPVSQWASHEQSTRIGNKTQAEQNYKDALMTLERARADFETKYGQRAQ